MNPIVEQLADCETHQARARWLLNVPVDVMLREQMDIRRLLRTAHFMPGLMAFDAEIALACAVRGSAGWVGDDMLKPALEGRAYLALLAGVGPIIGVHLTRGTVTEENTEGGAG